MASLPQEVSAAASAFNAALAALQTAQVAFDAQESIVNSLIQPQQQAVFEAQTEFVEAQQDLDAARLTAQATVPGWASASASLASATAFYAASRLALANLLDGEASPPDPV